MGKLKWIQFIVIIIKPCCTLKPAWWDEALVPFRVLWAKLVDVTWDAQMSPCNSAGNSRLWLYTGRTAAADSGQGPVKQRSQLCTSINVYFSLLLHQHIFSSFLSSNFYYTSIISIRTKSGRIHLNKTNFAVPVIRQSQNTRYSTSSNRYNIYREKYPKNVFIFYCFLFRLSPKIELYS